MSPTLFMVHDLTDNMTLVPETLDIAAGSRPCDTHQNPGMFSGDARDNDGVRHSNIMIQTNRLLDYSHLVTDVRHSNIMIQTYRLLDYSHRVTDIQHSQRPPDTTVGEASKRQKVYDFAMDATRVAALEGNQVSTTPTVGPNVRNRDRDAAENCVTPTSKLTVQEHVDTPLMTQVTRKHDNPKLEDDNTFSSITGQKRKVDIIVSLSSTSVGQTVVHPGQILRQAESRIGHDEDSHTIVVFDSDTKVARTIEGHRGKKKKTGNKLIKTTNSNSRSLATKIDVLNRTT
jgi:hypothetical protein